MPITFNTRMRRVLLELLESGELTPKERLDAARLLQEIDGKSGPKTGKKKTGLLG